MKKMNFKKAALDFWNDEEAQGMLEYILMAVAVVGIIALLGPRLRDMVAGKADDLQNQVQGFNVQ